ncbi:MAG: methionine biosynthesis protein MetW [Candidatus Sumerlaeia bacterium]
MPEQEANQNAIFEWICSQTPEAARVLDIGCGDGELLAMLSEKRRVKATGIEISESLVVKAVQRGLSVHHGNVEEGLDHYSDKNFDVVVLSLALQEMKQPLRVLEESFRVGKHVVVVFPNFGYWRVRWQLAILGRAPRTPSFPHPWSASPNRHYYTIKDWEEFCREQGWKVEAKSFLNQGKAVCCMPNLMAEVAMYNMTD